MAFISRLPLPLLLFLFPVVMAAQNIRVLEDQYRRATSTSERLRISYEIAQKAIGNDPAKASEYAHMAFNHATDLNNPGMMAKASYLNGEGYYKRRDYPNARIRYELGIKHAKESGDAATALNCYNKMEDIAIKSGDFRKAYTYSEQAVELLSKGVKPVKESFSGTGGGNPELLRKIEQLTNEKKALEQQLSSISTEKEVLKEDKSSLAKAKTQLAEEKMKTEQTLNITKLNLSEQEKAIREMSAEKAKIELIKATKEKENLKLTKQKAEADKTLAEQNAELRQKELVIARNANLRNILLLISASGIALAGLLFSRYRVKQRANQQLNEDKIKIEQAQRRADELLHNILPESIASELKQKNKAEAKRHEDATVLFTDFRNFSQISEQLTPEALVEELDYYFREFDRITKKYHLEKIKTIGDAYMCAAGLSGQRTTAIDMVRAAIEIQQFMESARQTRISEHRPYFEARLGIHTGPVVAGVVGEHKFAYDIWGDTVNIAARMEQNCEPGQINISETTYWQVKYNFDCQYRGKIAAKNKGEIDMYYVKGNLA